MNIKIIEFVLKYEVDDIVANIKDKNKDINKIISDLKDTRTQYGLKVQHIIEKLQEE